VDGLIKGVIEPLSAALAPGDVSQLENAFVMKAAVVYLFIVRPFSEISGRMAAKSAPPPDVQLLTEIRDLLRERRVAV